MNKLDIYLSHLSRDRQQLPTGIDYLVLDGFYAKYKFIKGLVDENLHAISKLRHDAHLRWLYTGEQKRLGRRKKYEGEILFDEHLKRFEQEELPHFTPLLSIALP